MPTINELPVAISVSDTDELVVSQSDIARSATRAQLLAGVQAALSLPSGTLLGRTSAGYGAPETISIGANLAVVNGTMSAPASFTISALPVGGSPGANDLLPLGQGGENAAVSFSTLAAAIAGVPGQDVSNAVAEPTGGVGQRRVADLLSDAISVESFGALGDGVTDDTSAFEAALASGRVVRLDGRVYVVNGPLTITGSTALIGVAPETVLLRANVVAPGTWIYCNAPSFVSKGVTFNAGGLAGTGSAVFGVGPECVSVFFDQCGFVNAAGAAGHGLLIAGSANVSLRLCAMNSNGGDGICVESASFLRIIGSKCLNNGGNGITIPPSIPHIICDNTISGNQVGVSMGDWAVEALNAAPCFQSEISGNRCAGNAQWGIAVACNGALVHGNSLIGNGGPALGGGIAGRIALGRVSHNWISGGAVGLDVRTSISTSVVDNHISGTGVGIDAGGCQNVMISANFVVQNGWGISVSAFEPDLGLSPAGPVTVDGNWIGFTSALGGGVWVTDGAQGIAITRNDINGWGSAGPAQALWVHTDAAVCRGNRWNNTAQYSIAASIISEQSALVFPDTADEILVTSAPPDVSSVLSLHQAATLGQVTFIKVSSPGQGYTQAQVTISGSGFGAAASAICSNGQVIGIEISNPGSGYGPIGAVAPVTISGNGIGAEAVAFVGLPVLAGRELRLTCACPLRLDSATASPAINTWSEYALSAPMYGALDLVGSFGGWFAVQSPPIDYLVPTGNGGAVLQSVDGGNVVLRPSSGGELFLASHAEPLGCTSTVGRGAPTGMIVAPAGSDFRNLNGGAGTTFWIKATGSDDNGWVAVA
jgi:hypothetical protein